MPAFAWPEIIELHAPAGCEGSPAACLRFGGGTTFPWPGEPLTGSAALPGGGTVTCTADDKGVFANVDAHDGIQPLPIEATCTLGEQVVKVRIVAEDAPQPFRREDGWLVFNVALGGFSGHSFDLALPDQHRRGSVPGTLCEVYAQGESRALVSVIDDRARPTPTEVTCRLRDRAGKVVHVVAQVGKAQAP
jgi:hypothetical protein